jgi:hypothetical protein
MHVTHRNENPVFCGSARKKGLRIALERHLTEDHRRRLATTAVCSAARASLLRLPGFEQSACAHALPGAGCMMWLPV